MTNKNLGKRAVDQFMGSAEDVNINSSYKKQRRDSSSIATPSQWQFHQEKGLQSSVEESATTTTTICTNTKCYGKKIPIHFFKTKRSNSVSGSQHTMWSPASTSTSPATNSEMGSIQGGGESDAFRLSPRIATAIANTTVANLTSPSLSEDKPLFRYWPEDTWISIFLEILQADHAMKFQIAELQQKVAALQEENQLLKHISLQ